MKPEDMDQEKLVAWIKSYLERSKNDLEAMRSAFYEFVLAGENDAAERQLKELAVKQDVHAMLFQELLEAEEYKQMLEIIGKMSKDAPEA
jgi:hypothetical protein